MVADNSTGARATTWIRRIARGIDSFVAGYWLFIGIVGAVSGREPWTLESAMIASFIIVLVAAVITAWWREGIGGTILVVCGAAFSTFAYFSAGHNQAIAVLVSGAPFLVAGVLFLVSWWRSRRSENRQNLAYGNAEGDVKVEVKFVDKPENLAKQPNLFALPKVIQISPLPDFEYVQALVSASRCPKCSAMSLRLLGYEISDKVAALFGRCKQCCSPVFAFFSEERPDSPNIIVVMSSAKDEAVCKELSELSCPVCNLKLEVMYKRDSEDYDIQRLLPAQVKCSNCSGGSRNIIFWDRPEYYFRQALALADEVIPCSSRGGLVFLVAALETFLQKAFLFQSTTNYLLIKRRKVNFQSLQEARDLYNDTMGIDLIAYATDRQWNMLGNAIRDRHGLIHNAGFDKRFELIKVDASDLPRLRAAIVDFVSALTEALETQALL